MSKEKKETSFFESAWDFLSSVKLALTLFFIMALASIIGTLIQQKAEPMVYLRQYGETIFKVFNALGFLDLYHSWWFITLLILFSANITICSIKRLPKVWKVVSSKEAVLEPAVYKGMAPKQEIHLKGTYADWEKPLEEILKQHKYQLLKNSSPDAHHYLAHKGRYTRLGVYVTHASILIIFLGVIIGAIFGFNGYVNIVEGQTVDSFTLRDRSAAKNLDFAVKCDEFEVTYYDGTNRPKDFISTLTVIDRGRPVMTKKIVVNDPLVYNGIYFYQASYGVAGGIKKLKLLVKHKDRPQEQGQVVELASGTPAKIGDLELEILRFVPDFAMDESMRIFSRSNELNNPALQLAINRPQKPSLATWVFAGMRGFHTPPEIPYDFAIIDINPFQYTGLQVAKDPGVWVVWTGCTLMMVGLLIAFFCSHRRVWVKLSPKEHKLVLQMAGNVNKNRLGFEREFEEIKAKINAQMRP